MTITRWNERFVDMDGSYELWERLNILISEMGFKLKTLGLISYYKPFRNGGAFIVDVFIHEDSQLITINTFIARITDN